MFTCENIDRTAIALYQSLHQNGAVERGKMFAIQTSPRLPTDFSTMGGYPFENVSNHSSSSDLRGARAGSSTLNRMVTPPVAEIGTARC